MRNVKEMLKIVGLVLIMLLVFPQVQAANDDGVISLFDGTSEAQPSKKNNNSAKIEKESDESSIFSFLNFKSKKKEDIKPIDATIQLTPIQQAEKQAETGDVNSLLFLGYSYLYGENGVTVNYDKAFQYYGQAAMKNDNVALNNLGSLYYSGIGIEKDTAKAAILFEKAAALDNAEATVNLAFIYLTGNGIAQDNAKAMELFEKGSKLGNPTAEFMLGYAYYKGFIMPKNYNRAAELVKKAARSNFDAAQLILAQMYMNGQGVPQNYGNAVKYLKFAVGQGNVEAMMLLGDILARGEKFNKDMFMAHVMFNLAAVRGASGAAEKRDLAASKLKIDEILQAQSEAERFKEKPSELTAYIHNTFGMDVMSYIPAGK